MGIKLIKISIICVGKIKEKFYREAMEEYSKRLQKYCKLEILEVVDEKTPDKASENEENAIKKKEAERILDRLKENTYVITLDVKGKRFSSETFSKLIEENAINGNSHISFVIGGSLGIHESIKERSNLLITFSDMTFPHQLMRVILNEQIYRAFRIMNNEPYHK